jgi:uncharacterized protein involved in response to NO
MLNNDPDKQIPLLSFGFRPFFLLAGFYAIVSMAAWITWLMLHAANAVIVTPSIDVPAHQWHGHEMLFGYTAAVVAGFMLTAVPGWTGARRVAGTPLAFLCAVWLAGRCAVWFSSILPALVISIVDMAFLAALAVIVAMALVKRPAPQNLVFVVLLGVLIVSNGAVHAEWLGWSEASASWGLSSAVMCIILMITLIGGRIVPTFTRNALIRGGHSDSHPRKIGWLERLSVMSVALVLGCYLTGLPDGLTGTVAGIAAVFNAIRLALWRWRSVLDAPILWSLHLAYAWVPTGLALVSLSRLADWPSHGAALHVLAVGAIGGMTLAMMTRAPLGHTGRALTVTRPIAVAYLLIAVAALLRGLALDVFAGGYFTVIFLAGACWIAGFAIFAMSYAAILTGPSLKDTASD